MADATGEAKVPRLRVAFDRRIKLELHGARITSDGGLLAYRELDDALGLTDMAITKLLDGRRGKNTRHKLSGLFRQAVFGRLAGYEDVNDAERLARDPAMCAIVGRDGFDRAAASSSQMGRFETGWLATDANLAALTDLSGTWIDRVHARKPPERIILDMDSSESLPHGEQAEAQFQPDGTAVYSGRAFDGIGRWRPWEKGYCAYYPWLGNGPGLRPPFSGRVEHDGYRCYEVRAESGYFVLFQPDGVYAGTLVPVPG